MTSTNPIGYIQNTNTGENCVTFYLNTTIFSDQFRSKVYKTYGITIPPFKSDNYPELKDKAWKRIYPDDGALFLRAFVELELPRLDPPNAYRYIKC